MILCRKCHIDCDRCECGTGEPKKTIGIAKVIEAIREFIQSLSDSIK